MGAAHWHWARAEHHLNFANDAYKQLPAYQDWAAVGYFYSALHMVHAALDGESGLPKDERHPRKHSAPKNAKVGGRGVTQLVRDLYAPAHFAYRSLFEASHRTRYDMHALASPQQRLLDDHKTVHDEIQSDPLELSIAGFLARYRGGTAVEYRRDMRLFLGWCMSHNLQPLQARRPHLELYVRWLEEQGWKSATISRRFGTVATYYKVAAMDDLIPKDPAAGVTRPRVRYEEQKRTVLTPVQFGALLEQSRQDGVVAHALVCLLGLMGLRIAEACSLNIESLGMARGYDTVTFVGKGGDTYTEPLPIPAMRAVRACVGDRETGPLLTTRTGNRMDRSAAGRMLRRLGADCGIKTEFSPHSLRRTFATTGILNGVPLRDVQLAMRHKNPNTTTRYDMRQNNLDRHAAHRIASQLSGMAG